MKTQSELPDIAILPPNFMLAHYRFTLEALEMLQLPPVKSSALRGGFGHTFKGLVCTKPYLCDKKCQQGNSCPYGYIFETTPPKDSEALRTFENVPRPFIISAPNDRRELIPAGERLSFGLTLVGHAINFLPYFIAIFRELGYRGLGRNRGRYRLLTVEAVSPHDNAEVPIYDAKDEVIQVVDTTISSETVANYTATFASSHQLTMDFLSPTRLKHRGRWVDSGPSFQALIQALLGRISSLSYFHCGQEFKADFRGLIDRAADVTVTNSDTRWEDWSRFSGRQKQRVNMGGLMGRITFAGDLQDYLPVLALGELIHVGKGTVFGNGQYRLQGGSRLKTSS